MQTTEAQHWEPTSYGAEVECDVCETEPAGGEVVVLDSMLMCPQCAAVRAMEIAAPLLDSRWTRADIEGGRRDYEEAREVLRIMLARIDARLRGGF